MGGFPRNCEIFKIYEDFANYLYIQLIKTAISSKKQRFPRKTAISSKKFSRSRGFAGKTRRTRFSCLCPRRIARKSAGFRPRQGKVLEFSGNLAAFVGFYEILLKIAGNYLISADKPVVFPIYEAESAIYVEFLLFEDDFPDFLLFFLVSYVKTQQIRENSQCIV